jgi:PUA domain protein
MAKCQNHVNIICASAEPLFFQQRDGPWYPTLRLVHRRKSCFATAAWQTDAGAIRFVVGGANIMCPGFTSEDGALDHELAKGSPVVINAFGKKHAMAVGQVLMTRDDVRSKNKGHCVENLYGSASCLSLARATMTIKIVSPDVVRAPL